MRIRTMLDKASYVHTIASETIVRMEYMRMKLSEYINMRR
jgi:hypothetical protein